MSQASVHEPAPTQATLLAALIQIEAMLIAAKLATDAPSPQALASVEPFCFDTLEFHAWLQWVFLPRMRDTLLQNKPLAAPCSIAPLAEYRFAELSTIDTAELLALITAFDRLANRYFKFEPAPSIH
jgi:uncharacterized protein YqcC (DUF446 family)